MGTSFKKRGQKIARRFSRLSQRVEEEGKEHLRENFFDRISHIHNIRLLILEWGLLVSALIMLAITQAIWFNNSYSDIAFVDGGTYTEGTIGKVNSLNPLFATTSSEKALSRLLFATLTTIDYSGHSGLGLADSVISSKDGKVWTIKLRDNLKWSDGEDITNEDVLFTVSLIQNLAINSIYDSNLANVAVAETEDGHITFTLPSSYADFSSALNIPVLPKHILADANPKTLIEHPFSSKPVTSGAFTFNALQILPNADERVFYLSTNPYYYHGKSMLSSFAVHTYPNENALIDAINAGKITATANIATANSDKISSSAIYEKRSVISSGVYAFLNTAKPYLNSKEFRQNIKRGISLEAIRTAADGEPSLDYPLIDSQIELNKPALIAENFEAANEAIAKVIAPLKENEEELTLHLVTVNSGHLPAITEAFANELKKLGINPEISTYDESQDFINNVIAKRNYDILIYEIELGAEPDLLAYYHSSQTGEEGLNLSDYKNVLVDDLILAGRETTNRELRVAKYESFLKYWVDDVPAIGIYQSEMSYFYNKNVRAFSDDNRLVNALDRFYDVESWAAQKESKNRTP